MKTVDEIERLIEQLASDDFERLAAWMDQRRRQEGVLQSPPDANPAGSKPYPNPEPSPRASMVLRDHSAFLNSYAPEDEGLYDDAAAR